MFVSTCVIKWKAPQINRSGEVRLTTSRLTHSAWTMESFRHRHNRRYKDYICSLIVDDFYREKETDKLFLSWSRKEIKGSVPIDHSRCLEAFHCSRAVSGWWSIATLICV